MKIFLTGGGVVFHRWAGLMEFSTNIFNFQPLPIPLQDLGFESQVPAGTALQATFDLKSISGRKKGLRVLDRTCELAMAASHTALHEMAYDPTNGDDVGVVLGTSVGSPSSLIQFIQETYTADQPYFISPEAFPRTVMNYAAGQVAIWYGLKALNTTIAGGRMAGLLSLQYAINILRSGHAKRMLAGSVQELTAQSAWLAFHMASSRATPMPVLSEGCGMFMLQSEPETDSNQVEVLGCEIATAESLQPADIAAALRFSIDRLLDRAQVPGSQVNFVITRTSQAESGSDLEDAVVRQVLGEPGNYKHYSIEAITGDSYCATNALQLATLLSLMREPSMRESSMHHSQGKRLGLITSYSNFGSAGCALVQG